MPINEIDDPHVSLSLCPTDPQTHSTFQKAPHFEAFVIFFSSTIAICSL